MRAAWLLATLLGAGPVLAAVDLDALWDFGRPASSEQRFRAALADAAPDDALVLRTQIARSLGLRGEFDAARRELDAIAPLLPGAGAEPRVHALLERGRVLRSSGRAAEAEPFFASAFEQARHAQLEFLAGDALHMQALVQATPEAQIEWNRRLVAQARAARDARAQRWEAVALNNIGSTLNELGRHAEALEVLRQAQSAYQRFGRAANVRVARWMVAHTLRRLARLDEALAAQRELEAEAAAAGSPDPYVFEELAAIHDARGDADRAAHYRALAARAR